MKRVRGSESRGKMKTPARHAFHVSSVTTRSSSISLSFFSPFPRWSRSFLFFFFYPWHLAHAKWQRTRERATIFEKVSKRMPESAGFYLERRVHESTKSKKKKRKETKKERSIDSKRRDLHRFYATIPGDVSSSSSWEHERGNRKCVDLGRVKGQVGRDRRARREKSAWIIVSLTLPQLQTLGSAFTLASYLSPLVPSGRSTPFLGRDSHSHLPRNIRVSIGEHTCVCMYIYACYTFYAHVYTRIHRGSAEMAGRSGADLSATSTNVPSQI